MRTSAVPIMQAKMILADAPVPGALASVGSHNLTTAALDNSREVSILVADPAVLATLAQTFQQGWTGAQALEKSL